MSLTEIDRNLLKKCLAEEPGAWKDFVDRFMGLFVHVVNHTAHARSVKLAQEDVDDLVGEVFLALLAQDYAVLRRFRGESSLATYLTVIARRVVVHGVIRRRMAEALGHVVAQHPDMKQQADSHHFDLKRIEDQEEVRRMLVNLPAGEAEVVKQFHLEGRSYREISSQLGIPPARVKNSAAAPRLNEQASFLRLATQARAAETLRASARTNCRSRSGNLPPLS
jgi:RNA polymerase sigma-70 factor (ECF subfamily)